MCTEVTGSPIVLLGLPGFEFIAFGSTARLPKEPLEHCRAWIVLILGSECFPM
jgi:hypothetical protein